MALLAPLVAADASGDIATQGPATFDGPSGGRYQASAFFLPDASALASLSVVGSARLCHNEWTLQEVQVPQASSNPLYRQPTDKKEGCFDTDAITLSLGPGAMGGWLGGRFSGPGAFDFTGAGPVVVQPSASSTMANPDAYYGTTNPTQDSPDKPWFFERTVGPHLNITASGTARYHGTGEIKFMGLSVTVTTPANRTDYQTGDTAGTGPLHQREWRWMTVDFVGDLVLESPRAALEVQATAASVSWEGVARFVAESGTLTMDGRSYPLAAGEPATLEGRFSADVKPEGSDGSALRVSLAGEARNAALGSVRVATVPGGPAFPWATVAGVVVAAVVVGGTTVAALRRHARPRRALQAEALAREAGRLAEEGGMAREALALYQAAIRRAPSAAYFLASGHLWRELGKPRRALRCFARAAKTGKGGAAEYGAIIAALDLGAEDAAAGLVVLALQRGDLEPRLLSVFATDAGFAVLREREPVKEALEAAKQRQESRGWPSLR